MKKSILIFALSLTIGYTTVSTLNANNRIEALANNVESLQNKLDEVENGLKNETSEIRNSLADEVSKLNLRVEKIEK